MKTIIIIVIFIAAFAGFFLTISLFGCLWRSYGETITDPNWFICYIMLLGWNLPLWVARSYYLDYQAYFDR